MKYEIIFMLNNNKVIEFDRILEYKIGETVKINGEKYEICKVVSDSTKDSIKIEYHLQRSLWLGIDYSNPISWDSVKVDGSYITAGISAK